MTYECPRQKQLKSEEYKSDYQPNLTGEVGFGIDYILADKMDKEFAKNQELIPQVKKLIDDERSEEGLSVSTRELMFAAANISSKLNQVDPHFGKSIEQCEAEYLSQFEEAA